MDSLAFEKPMKTPKRLIGQVAAESGVTAARIKLGLYLAGLASREGGTTLAYAAHATRRKPETVRRIARKFIIDFADYRPFAAMERRGEPRPEPVAHLEGLASHDCQQEAA